MKLESASKKYPYFKRDPKSGIYWVDAYWSDHPSQKRLTRSTRERSNKTRALEKAHRMYAEWRGKPFDHFGRKRMKFDVTADRFVTERSNKNRALTTNKINSVMKRLKPAFKSYYIDQIDEALWLNYLATGVPRAHEQWVYLKATLKMAVRDGFLKKVPELSKPEPSDFRGTVLTAKEIESLSRHVDGFMRLVLIMGLGHAMRRREMIQLTWDRVDLDKRRIHLRRADVKTKKARTFPISRELVRELKKHRKSQPEGTKWVFPSPKKKGAPLSAFDPFWRALKAEAGITRKMRVHDLRHTYLTEAAKQIKAKKSKFSAVEICVFAGLSMEVFMKHYLHLEADDLMQLCEVVAVKLRESK
tara:strand:+ start:15801 stop:16877 length:1077 start_codon:yes stop_codon:yes gene_type:complete